MFFVMLMAAVTGVDAAVYAQERSPVVLGLLTYAAIITVGMLIQLARGE